METGKLEEMESLYITFQSEDDIIHFVDTCNRYDDAIDVVLEKRSTDAKSILGMLRMPQQVPLQIVYGCYDDEDNYEEFKEDILKNYQVEVRPVAGKPTSSAPQ